MIHKNDVIDEKGLRKMFLIYKQEKKLEKQYKECQLTITPPQKRTPNQTKPKQNKKHTRKT